VEYGVLTGTVLDHLSAPTFDYNVRGGAGTIFTRGPTATWGDLVVDNADLDGSWTVLPSLGSGTAQAGSSGAVLETDLPETIPPYFVGHRVEVRLPDDTLKGTWRIEAIDGTTLTLETGAAVAEGDLWFGLYRFDSVLVTGNAKLRIDDLDEIDSITVDPGSTLVRANLGGPTFDPGAIVLEGSDGVFTVTGLAGAITDPDGISAAEAVNTSSGGSWPLTVQPDGSFPTVAVTGTVGDVIRIVATDVHPVDPRSSSTEIGSLPANTAAPTVDVGLIGYAYDGSSVHLLGSPGAVTDANPPIAIVVDNTSSGGSWSTTAAVDGSFDVLIAGS